MPGTASEESIVGRSFEGISSGQLQCQSGEAIAEWRSSEQVENGSPSTSPPYWDTDDEDGCGPKPPELYGKYTWKIDKFSHINKRELRSNAFEVGGYKWYILIYPQGCDVCNHLSLFLCVANHDKLLPGWSHFAQFTIAVVNKDPKKSKYSDTLHRFWKKEHDWGWKKFMELSKLLDGFIDADTLIIKAQVQVIREKADRPFRCLDRQYRRELVRVYLTNVEQICRRFVEERRGKLGKLIEDKARWLSFRSFWMGMDQNAQRHMSREKTDSILKVVVKHFFIEKEVTSTLVMDSLYSGLKALEGLNKSKKCKGKSLDAEEQLVPIVHIEQDIFALVDDVLLLLERAALEPLPPKDEKGPQNRTKDGVSGEDFNKDSIERDERRLTELGRRTIEIFVLAHIFSKIEVSYQEAVAWKRQEELIREEEAAWLAESEQKAKRAASEKEKKSKRKQGKQRRNNRKRKDKGKDERLNIVLLGKAEQEIVDDGRKCCLIEEAEPVLEKADVLEDVSDVSDSIDCIPEILPPDSDDRDTSPVNWDTDTSEVHPFRESCSGEVSALSAAQNVAGGKKGLSVLDDSSSTCSTDSIRSVAMNTPNKGNSFPNNKSQRSPIRGKNQRGTDLTVWSSEGHSRSSDLTCWSSEVHSRPFDVARDVNQPNDVSENCKAAESELQAVEISLHDRIKWPDLHEWKKEEVISLHRECSIKDEADIGRPQTDKAMKPPSSPNSPSKILPFAGQPKSDSVIDTANDTLSNKKEFSDGPKQMDKATSLSNLAETTTASRPMAGKTEATRPIGKPLVQQVTVTVEKPSTLRVIGMSRPSSAPLIPGPRPTVPVVSVVQTMPLLGRSVSAAGRLGPESSHTSHGYVPQSYRNAIMSSTVPSSSASFISPHSLNPLVNSSASYSQLSSLISAPIYLPQNPERMEANSIKTSFSFGMVNQDVLPNGSQWMDYSPRVSNRSIHSDHLSQHNDITNFDLYKPVCSRSQDHFISEYPASPSTSGRPNSGLLVEDFPHLDIINDLLDDEHGMGKATRAGDSFQTFSSGPRQLNRQFTFPGYMGSDMGPSTSSCRFERTRRYLDDGLQRGFAYPVGGNFDTTREMISQSSPPTYANREIDGLIPNHWQMAGSDLSTDSMLRMRNTENDAYLYHVSDYTNLACGVNGYAVFRPSHGH